MGGMVLETQMNDVIEVINNQKKIEKQENPLLYKE